MVSRTYAFYCHETIRPPSVDAFGSGDQNEFVQTIEYLKAENRILRGKLPKRIEVTPAERARLLELGTRLGSKIREVITIVHPRTFARGVSEKASGKKIRKRGRPRTAEQIRLLIIQMAEKNQWDYE
jgi:putative transposase